MTDPTPEQQQEQYAAIELLYSEGKWNEVLAASQSLLDALPPVQGHPLRPRLDLVIGHTLLYGLVDPHGAEPWYRTVLLDTEETVLREIAEQGLVRCNEQRAGTEASSGIESPEEAETTEVIGTLSADATSEPPSGAASMPWETAAGQEPPGISDEGAGSLGSSAAMPWLAELGIEPPASTDGPPPGAFAAAAFAAIPGASPVISDSVRTVRNVETTTLQKLPQEGPAAEAPELVAAAASPAGNAADLAPEANESSTSEETLALLREPDELIPVTVQVLEEPDLTSPGPERPNDEPPLSPEDMAELARGLLEVVLR